MFLSNVTAWFFSLVLLTCVYKIPTSGAISTACTDNDIENANTQQANINMASIDCVIPGSMQAIQVSKWGGPEVLEVADIPVPKITADDQVLIKIEAAGVNPVDTYIHSGTYARSPKLPYTPGSDGAGTIVLIGRKVTSKHA